MAIQNPPPSALAALIDPTAPLSHAQVQELLEQGYDLPTITAFRSRRHTIAMQAVTTPIRQFEKA